MEAIATAGSNIAIVKYWGARDLALRLPANGSISLTLDAATTTTRVRFDASLSRDVVILDGAEAGEEERTRVSQHLDRVRAHTLTGVRALVESTNSFPMGAGIASSASGFAALTVAAAAALGVSLSDRELGVLARLGSGSACRSMIAGWAEWLPGRASEDSYAQQLAPPEHWGVRDVIAILEQRKKTTPSTEGHRRALTSPLFAARLQEVERTLPEVREAIAARDFAMLGRLAEAEALSMHAIAMTSQPPLLYWLPGTIELIRAVWGWRGQGLPCYFTIDAGPNVHVLTLADAVQEVIGLLQRLSCIQRIMVCGPGPGPRVERIS